MANFELNVFPFPRIIFSVVLALNDFPFCICFQELIDTRISSPEKDQVPLNEYRRSRLMRLSENLRNKRNRFAESVEEN